MSAWGSGGLAKSCNSLLTRVEKNDPSLDDLVILPSKKFGEEEVNRISSAFENKSNTHLKSLSASGHALPTAALHRLGRAISLPHSSLVRLAIGDRNLGDNGAVALCSSLELSRGGSLQSVDLEWKGLSVDAMAALGRCFRHSPSLRHLNLSRNDSIGDAGIIEFCKHSASEDSEVPFPNLEYLDLSDCRIGPDGLCCLVECLKPRLASLGPSVDVPLELKLNLNPLGSKGCAALSKLLRGKSSLRSLSVSKCDIGNDGIQIVAEESIECPFEGLNKLDISHNSIGAQGTAALSKSLFRNGLSCWTNLYHLSLAGNNLGEDGAKSLAGALCQTEARDQTDDESLEGNTAIRELDLSQTCCGVEGAAAVVQCRRLSSVRLFNNKLGSEGFRALSAVLHGGHPSIENLDLGGNNADIAAVVGLLQSLTEKAQLESRLQVLEIGGNQSGDEVEEAIQKLQVVRPNLDVARDRPRRSEESETNARQPNT